MNFPNLENKHFPKTWSSGHPRFEVKHGASLVGGDGNLPAYAKKSTQIGFAIGAVLIGAALIWFILHLAMRGKGKSRKARRKQNDKAKSR
jgi:hypothetical protein